MGTAVVSLALIGLVAGIVAKLRRAGTADPSRHDAAPVARPDRAVSARSSARKHEANFFMVINLLFSRYCLASSGLTIL